MTDASFKLLIENVVPIFTAAGVLATVVISALAKLQIDRTHVATNSRMDQLLAAATDVARIEISRLKAELLVKVAEVARLEAQNVMAAEITRLKADLAALPKPPAKELP